MHLSRRPQRDATSYKVKLKRNDKEECPSYLSARQGGLKATMLSNAFLELYMPITRFLEDLEGSVSSDISSKACQLLSAITRPEFVVSLHIISGCFP